MWKPQLKTMDQGATRGRTNSGVMAHRREVGGRKLLTVSLLVLVVAAMSVGSVYVTNQVTRLRLEIARLEDQREFLEAGSARLLRTWNKVSAASVVVARAERELGLVVPDEPGLVLVQMPEDGGRISTWRRLLSNMAGGDPAQAGEVSPGWVMGAMVSLTPRQPSATGGN